MNRRCGYDGSLPHHERGDRHRQRDVMRREHQAIVSQCDDQPRVAGQTLFERLVPRVVIAHRSVWFVDKVASVLWEHGVSVVARVDNRVEAVGAVVAEQPDALLVEHSFPRFPPNR